MSDCPLPHDTDRVGYCGACGLALEPALPPCPDCGEPRGSGRFCEACGHRYAVQRRPAEDRPARWVAVVAADRELFDTSKAASCGFEFPTLAERRIELTGSRVRIGRQSRRHPQAPDIDLAGPPADPGVSRDHAQLLRQSDGLWVLVDTGSANGTYVNGSRERVARNALVPLAPGDRIRIGMWTSITVHAIT